MDGSISSKLILNGREGSFKLSSSKLELNEFNIEDIAIDAEYSGELITIDRALWRVTGLLTGETLIRKFLPSREEGGDIDLGRIDILVFPILFRVLELRVQGDCPRGFKSGNFIMG